MAFLSGALSSKDWVAISLHADRVDLACVKRKPGSRPEVALLDSYRKENGEKEALGRLRKALRLANYRCATLLGAGEYQILQTEAPAVAVAEVKEAVRWRIKDMLDFPPDVATLDVLNIPTDGAGKARQLFVVAANNGLIGERMALFDEAKIPLEVIDIQETAQRNIAALFEAPNRGLAMLAFDESGGLLTFTYKGELYLSRRIEISLSQLMQQEALRRQQLLERIGLELQRSLDHFDRQFSFIPLAQLLIVPIAGVPEIFDYLRLNLFVPIEPLDLAQVMDFPSIPELKNSARQAQCLHVIGAALRDEVAA